MEARVEVGLVVEGVVDLKKLMLIFRSRLVFNYQACVDIKGSQAHREQAEVPRIFLSLDSHLYCSALASGRKAVLTTLLP